jgi:hypothetical protein
MILARGLRRISFAATVALFAAGAYPAMAQDVSDEQVRAARAAISAIRATDLYDGILPEAAANLKATLIQKNPDLQDVIIRTVDEKALALASRRSDLEREAATIYARAFSIEELNAIATFYTGEAGKKLLQQGPLMVQQVGQAAEIWHRGVARDLAEEVGKSLQAYASARGEPAPAQ